ncbi:alpha/beta fold hydrolase [Streptomyces sp. NPDC001966]
MPTTPAPSKSFDHHFAHVNGVRPHYVSIGSAEPLVLLPGWPRTWWQYRTLVPLLARHVQVIVCEYWGMGESQKPARKYDKATKEHLATDIRLVEIPDAGHYLSEEQPQLLSRELINFFKDRTGAPLSSNA